MKTSNNIIALFAFVIIGFSLTSCDKVEAPYKEKIVKPNTEKKVLLEDFTGHKCVNCPAAHDLAHDLTDAYGEDNLIVVAIHAGFFATPSNGGFEYDFRTEAGNEYATFYGVQAYPSGMVDQVNVSGNYLLDKDQWGAKVAQQFEEIPQIGIGITTNLNGNNLSGEIKMDFLTDINQATSLQIWITEDSIVKPQIIPGGEDEAYVHMHVLRAAINGTWGEELPSANYSAETSETLSFSNYQLGDDWVPKNLSLVALVYDNETKKVIQVERKKIIE